MKKEFTVEEILALESQLSCPEGKNGIELGDRMHNSNIGMTRAAINTLEIGNQQSILELGHGNCNHLHEVLDKATNVSYYGLEIWSFYLGLNYFEYSYLCPVRI